MNLRSNLERMDLLHQLILSEKTGTPKQLAEKLGICRATVYLLIDELNSFNMQVAYSRKNETFCYEKRVELTLSFKVQIIENSDELRNINGGNLTFFLPSVLLDGTNLSLYSY